MNGDYAPSSAVLKQQPFGSSVEMKGALFTSQEVNAERRSPERFRVAYGSGVVNSMQSPPLAQQDTSAAQLSQDTLRPDRNGELAPSALSTLFVQGAEMPAELIASPPSSSSFVGTGGPRVVRAVTPSRIMTPRQSARDITPVRNASPRIVSRQVFPTTTADSGLSRAALAATFQGVPAVALPQNVEVLPSYTFAPPVTVTVPAPIPTGLLPAPQPVVEVLPPVAAAYSRPVGLVQTSSFVPGTGSFRAPPGSTGSYVPPAIPIIAPGAIRPGSILQSSPSMQMLQHSMALQPQPAPLNSSFRIQPQPPPGAAKQEKEMAQFRLTAGVPDIETVERQKMAYGSRLDNQARAEEELLKMKHQQEKILIHQAAESRKKQAILAIEQEAKQQELELDQQHNMHRMGMQQELQAWKLLLQQQASNAILDFQARKSQEELMIAKFEAQQAQQMTAQQKRGEKAD